MVGATSAKRVSSTCDTETLRRASAKHQLKLDRIESKASTQTAGAKTPARGPEVVTPTLTMERRLACVFLQPEPRHS